MNNLVINAVHHDLVINAINNKTLTASNLDFKLLRRLAGIDSNRKSELDWGRATILRQDLLNQYLYSYGLMVQRQWEFIIPETLEMLNTNNGGKVHIFDYGCGQGLASLLTLQYITGLLDKTEKITLIEPSKIALDRAKAILECKVPHAEVYVINKELDELKNNEIIIDKDKMNLHLFSNVLDINTFDYLEVFKKSLEYKGTHYFIAVSPDRNFQGGSPRLESLFNTLGKQQAEFAKHLKISHAEMNHFTDTNNMNHIYFYLKIEVN